MYYWQDVLAQAALIIGGVGACIFIIGWLMGFRTPTFGTSKSEVVCKAIGLGAILLALLISIPWVIEEMYDEGFIVTMIVIMAVLILIHLGISWRLYRSLKRIMDRDPDVEDHIISEDYFEAEKTDLRYRMLVLSAAIKSENDPEILDILKRRKTELKTLSQALR